MRELSTTVLSNKVSFTPVDNQRLAELCGQFDEHLRLIEKHLDVEIVPRGHLFQITGKPKRVESAAKILNMLYDETQSNGRLTSNKIYLLLQETLHNQNTSASKNDAPMEVSNKFGRILPRGKSQTKYVENIKKYDVTFGIGPAGTGKTYLAVAMAVDALEKELVHRIILTRPAVEAGERLGYLPGDLTQKIDPYLRPLYDALFEMLGFEQVTKLLAKNIIEIAPLAYMRGRTLSDSFIILDESQNTTVEQMKMFLTRIGFGSVAVITGDITQVDLPRGATSGLMHAIEVLKNVSSISMNYFTSKDAVRHPIVKQVIDAYEKYDTPQKP